MSLTLFIAELPSQNLLLSLAACLFTTACFTAYKYREHIRILWPFTTAFFGFAYTSIVFQHQLDHSFPTSLESKDFYVTGSIAALPDANYKRSRFTFVIERAFNVKNTAEYLGLSSRKIQLSCYRCKFSFAPNQRWQLRVRLKRPHRYASWGAFDYEKYLFSQQVIANGYVRDDEKNQLLEEPHQHSANGLRAQIREFLNLSLGETVGKGILLALLIGDKSQLNNEHKQVLQNLGLSHLMAISGLHIGIVFLCTSWLLRILMWPFARIYYWQPRQHIVLVPALLTAFAYSALAGFAISTQRALIMLVIYVLCRFIARDISLLRVLLLTAFVVLIYDPRSILDVGFWLSFNAVLVIALFSLKNNRVDEDVSTKKLNLWKLQPILWLGMLPISLLFFTQTSLISPLVNLIVVPLFSLTVIPLALAALVFWMSGMNVVAVFLLTNMSKFLDYIFIYFNELSSIDNVVWHVNSLSAITWLVYGGIIVAYLCQAKHRHFTWLLLITAVLLPLPVEKLNDAEFKLTLLDVGQGLSMVVQTKESVLVYDTGPAYDGSFSTASSVLIPYLRQQRVTEINDLVISHADNDHIGGVTDLLTTFRTQRILTSRTDEIINSQECVKDQQWQHDGVLFEILSPNKDTPQGSNNRSCVLKVSSEFGSVLMTGDIEKKVEAYLLNQNVDLHADILLAPHHGSNSSSKQDFINAVNPNLVLFSAGYRNRYKHPHPKVVKRYSHKEQNRQINLLSTIGSGSIEIKFTEHGKLISTFRGSEQHFWSVKK